MTTFKTLQDAHMALLAQQDSASGNAEVVRDAQAFIAEAVTGSTWIADPGERDLLRAYLRYWAGVIYERTGIYPKTELRPAEITAPQPGATERPVAPPTPTSRPQPASRSGTPGWLWLLGGLLGLFLLAVAAFLVFNRGVNTAGEAVNPDFPSPATALPAITRTIAAETSVPSVPIDQANAIQITPLVQADAHTGGALAVAFDPARPEVATAGADGSVRFWVIPSLTLSRQLNDQSGWVRTVAYSPYGGGSVRQQSAPALILTGGNDRTLRVYELESLQLFAEYLPAVGNSGFVFAGRFSPNELVIASGHGDGVARIWDITSGTETQTIQDTRLAQIPSGGTAVLDVAYRADGANLALALGGTDTGVVVVDNSYTNPVCSVNSGPATAVAYAPRSDLLAAGTENGRLLLLSPSDCRAEAVLAVPAHEGGVTDVAFSPSGDWLVTGGRDGTMKIWSLEGKALATLTVGPPVEAVAVSPGSEYIGSADADGRLILWGITQ